MKLISAGIAVLTLLICQLAGCSHSKIPSIGMGQSYDLHAGSSVSIENADLVIAFDNVTGDSRCPDGAVCVWEGEATGKIRITHLGITTSKDLVQSGRNENSEEDFLDYKLLFTLYPYPKIDETIANEDYYLRIKVIK